MKTIKFLLVSMIACALHTIDAYAQESRELSPKITKGYFDTRVDYLYEDTGGESNSGFHGRYLNFRIDGTFNDQLSFSWRQRLNKFKATDSDVFSATDWIYINYQPCRNFSVSGGKQVVLIGGYEYDANPIDIYFASRFWNNIACYQFGASATYHSNDGAHSLTLQICNSPYQNMSSSCYAYNLYWAGKMGWLSTLWSINMIEYAKGQYVNYISLGNRAVFGSLSVEADIMNRATSKHKYWFNDYSLIGKAEYSVTPWMTIMAKGGKDRIGISIATDGSREMWPTGSEALSKPFYGGGLIFYPYHGSPNVRLHAIADRYYDNLGTGHTDLSIGVMWRLNWR